MKMLVFIAMVLFSLGSINALIPILIIITLLVAAAGLNRGYSLFNFFGLATLAGINPSGKASIAGKSGFGFAGAGYLPGSSRHHGATGKLGAAARKKVLNSKMLVNMRARSAGKMAYTTVKRSEAASKPSNAGTVNMAATGIGAQKKKSRGGLKSAINWTRKSSENFKVKKLATTAAFIASPAGYVGYRIWRSRDKLRGAMTSQAGEIRKNAPQEYAPGDQNTMESLRRSSAINAAEGMRQKLSSSKRQPRTEKRREYDDLRVQQAYEQAYKSPQGSWAHGMALLTAEKMLKANPKATKQEIVEASAQAYIEQHRAEAQVSRNADKEDRWFRHFKLNDDKATADLKTRSLLTAKINQQEEKKRQQAVISDAMDKESHKQAEAAAQALIIKQEEEAHRKSTHPSEGTKSDDKAN
ncbi:MAG: hypothetical protein ACYCO0_01535 [Candidatus Micrarchaeaceae archaeon]